MSILFYSLVESSSAWLLSGYSDFGPHLNSQMHVRSHAFGSLGALESLNLHLVNVTVCLSYMYVSPVRVYPSDKRDKIREGDRNINEPNQQIYDQHGCWCHSFDRLDWCIFLWWQTDVPHPLHLQGTLSSAGSVFPATITTAAKTKKQPYLRHEN